MNNGDRLLKILDILEHSTDEEHPIRTAELIERLDAQGIPTERKTVYRCVETLIDNGFDILCVRSPEQGYYLASRPFEEVEIRLLIDAVLAASFVTQKKTDVLVSKLLNLVSEHQGRQLRNRVFIENRVKSTNEYIYYAVDRIGNAIDQGKKITLNYTKGESARKHKISPYAMAWNNDKFYLIGNTEGFNDLVHLRLDRIGDVEIINEAARPFCEVSEYKTFFDSADYVSGHINMFGGKEETVELLCTNKGYELLLDRFEPTAKIKKENGIYVRIKATTGQGMVNFLALCGKEIRVLSPKSLSDSLVSHAKDILSLYGN